MMIKSAAPLLMGEGFTEKNNRGNKLIMWDSAAAKHTCWHISLLIGSSADRRLASTRLMSLCESLRGCHRTLTPSSRRGLRPTISRSMSWTRDIANDDDNNGIGGLFLGRRRKGGRRTCKLWRWCWRRRRPPKLPPFFLQKRTWRSDADRSYYCAVGRNINGNGAAGCSTCFWSTRI